MSQHKSHLDVKPLNGLFTDSELGVLLQNIRSGSKIYFSAFALLIFDTIFSAAVISGAKGPCCVRVFSLPVGFWQ